MTRFLASSYGHLALASYNRVVATLGSLFAYTTAQGHTVASPAAGLHRRRMRGDRHTHARTQPSPKPNCSPFCGSTHPIRDKTLWWLLYDSVARASEVLA